MTVDRSKDLASAGYEQFTTVGVGLPHYVWRLDLELEFDRDLRLMEETILGLVDAGVGEPQQLAGLMGLDDGRMVPGAIVALLRQDALREDAGRLALSPLGQLMVQRATARDTQRYGVGLRHDPYRDVVAWDLGDREHTAERLPELGLVALPAPGELSDAEMEARHREIQALLDREGLPTEDGPPSKDRRREVVRVQVLKHYVAYREADLEVWRHPRDDDWRWVLRRGDAEDHVATQRLEELEAEGVDVIPLRDTVDAEVGAGSAELHAAVGEAVRGGAQVVRTRDVVARVLDAIGEVRGAVLAVLPRVGTRPGDGDILDGLRRLRDRKGDVRVDVGYSRVLERGGRRAPGAAAHPDAVRQLQRLRDQSRGKVRLGEVDDLPDRVLVLDDRVAFVTQAQIVGLRGRAGKGIGREVTYCVTEKTSLATLRRVTAALVSRPS